MRDEGSEPVVEMLEYSKENVVLDAGWCDLSSRTRSQGQACEVKGALLEPLEHDGSSETEREIWPSSIAGADAGCLRARPACNMQRLTIESTVLLICQKSNAIIQSHTYSGAV